MAGWKERWIWSVTLPEGAGCAVWQWWWWVEESWFDSFYWNRRRRTVWVWVFPSV